MMSKGVGYCLSKDCDEFCRGLFFLGEAPTFCAACHGKIDAVLERTHASGVRPFRQARVEFNYDAAAGTYREVAVVTDEALPDGAVFHMFTPLIGMENRALILAEQWLARLQLTGEGIHLDNTRPLEILLSWDKPRAEYFQELDIWAGRLAASQLVQRSGPAHRPSLAFP